jgi:hypothetical protein
MTCPSCRTGSLTERERDGILVDVCGRCRGIWFDRGELEKLVVRASRALDELDEFDEFDAPRDARPPRPMRRADGDRRPPPGRRRHWIEAFGDMFD